MKQNEKERVGSVNQDELVREVKKVKKDICRIPVEIAYRIVDGHPVEVSRVEKDIPADAIARFLMQKLGKTPEFLEREG